MSMNHGTIFVGVDKRWDVFLLGITFLGRAKWKTGIQTNNCCVVNKWRGGFVYIYFVGGVVK